MNVTRSLLTGILMAAAGTWALAQQAPAAPASAAATTQDCGKPGMAPHNHGAEKNMGAMARMGCPGMEAAGKKADMAQPAASAPKAKASGAHDHAKIHKNQ